MTDRRDDTAGPDSRDQRLGQALRANLARRKAQARARSAGSAADPAPDGPAAEDNAADNAAAGDTQNKTAPHAGGETGKDS
ncbi:hypothetical protein E4191_08675 [Paracoccus liaowanqingii]|uniref:Uncharacterized protein n=1 Tax=Paracoccus liaowanqingii TaxID=2560053 RepID=A0A4P7HKR3_9RHOB|nr:hypothetical protein [Paracoccus liaowanqingii]QBX34778.1 hypothetical protein E4191_08675 [Paracoccus liaowanqingii]